MLLSHLSLFCLSFVFSILYHVIVVINRFSSANYDSVAALPAPTERMSLGFLCQYMRLPASGETGCGDFQFRGIVEGITLARSPRNSNKVTYSSTNSSFISTSSFRLELALAQHSRRNACLNSYSRTSQAVIQNGSGDAFAFDFVDPLVGALGVRPILQPWDRREGPHATLDEVLSDSRSSTHCHERFEICQELSGLRAVYI